jgi:transposase-like protein
VNRRSRVESTSFAGYRFPPEVILLAVRWYLRYGLSYRDVEELLAESGIDVDHLSIYRLWGPNTRSWVGVWRQDVLNRTVS